MRGVDFDAMSDEELWLLYEEMKLQLKRRLLRKKAKIEDRLRRIERTGNIAKQLDGARRHPYRKVPPKYQNPKNPHEIWSGRGKLPLWLRAQLQTGKKLNDFLIASSQRESRGR